MIELLQNPPHISGPTWQKTVDGRWHLPEKTLGWEVLSWLSEYVRTPAGENNYDTQVFLLKAGLSLEAFVPTMEQSRFILWWYAVDEEGRYAYREGVYRRMKGAGKLRTPSQPHSHS